MTDCKCTEPSYTIELNQQGPPGKQGFSPTITVDTYTDDSYILKITNETNEFLTPDLFLQREDYAKVDFSNIDNPVTLNGNDFATTGNTLINTTIDGTFRVEDPLTPSNYIEVTGTSIKATGLSHSLGTLTGNFNNVGSFTNSGNAYFTNGNITFGSVDTAYMYINASDSGNGTIDIKSTNNSVTLKSQADEIILQGSTKATLESTDGSIDILADNGSIDLKSETSSIDIQGTKVTITANGTSSTSSIIETATESIILNAKGIQLNTSDYAAYYNGYEIATENDVSTALTEAKAYTNTEKTRAKAAEKVNATAISNETTRAKTAEETLQTNIDTLTTELSEKQDKLTAGSGITIEDNIINANTATTDNLGIVKPDGTTITISEDGTITGVEQYTLPTATTDTLGGIKVGTGAENTLTSSITDDVLTIQPGVITEELYNDDTNKASGTAWITYKPTVTTDETTSKTTTTFYPYINCHSLTQSYDSATGKWITTGNLSSRVTLTRYIGNSILVEAPLVKTFASTVPYGATLSLAIDNQTIQVNDDGQLVANLDELGNEVNTLAGRVTTLETELATANTTIADLETRLAALEELINGGTASD